jgi:hypothetical protein
MITNEANVDPPQKRCHTGRNGSSELQGGPKRHGATTRPNEGRKVSGPKRNPIRQRSGACVCALQVCPFTQRLAPAHLRAAIREAAAASELQSWRSHSWPSPAVAGLTGGTVAGAFTGARTRGARPPASAKTRSQGAEAVSEARQRGCGGLRYVFLSASRGCPPPPRKQHPCAPCAPAAGLRRAPRSPAHAPCLRASSDARSIQQVRWAAAHGCLLGGVSRAKAGARASPRRPRTGARGLALDSPALPRRSRPRPRCQASRRAPSSGWRRRHGLCFPVSRRASARRCHGDCCGSTGRATRRHRSTCTASRKVPSQALRARRFWSLQDFRSLSPGKDVRERPKIQKTPNQGSGFWFLGNRSPGGLLTTKGQTQMKITRGNYDGAKAAHARLSNETPKEKGQK